MLNIIRNHTCEVQLRITVENSWILGYVCKSSVGKSCTSINCPHPLQQSDSKPSKRKQRSCYVCAHLTKSIKLKDNIYECSTCEVALFVHPCFQQTAEVLLCTLNVPGRYFQQLSIIQQTRVHFLGGWPVWIWCFSFFCKICYCPWRVGHVKDFEDTLLRFLPYEEHVLVMVDMSTDLPKISNKDSIQLTNSFHSCNLTILPLNAIITLLTLAPC